MRRRTFLATLLASAAIPALGIEDRAFAQAGGAGTVTPTVLDTFMQDYALGSPFLAATGGETACLSRGGVINIYCPIVLSAPVNGSYQAVNRVFTSSTSQTSWANEQIVLPPEPEFPRWPWSPGATPLGGPPPTCLVIVGRDAQPDRLFVYNKYSLKVIDLQSDGSFAPNIVNVTTVVPRPSTINIVPNSRIPLLRGHVPGHVPYILELETYEANPALPPSPDISLGYFRQGLIWARMLTPPYSQILIGNGTLKFELGWQDGIRQQVLPLKASTPDNFAFINVTENATVAFVNLAKRALPDGSAYLQQTGRGEIFLGNWSGERDCVHVVESTPGTIELLVVNPADVLSVPGTYDTTSFKPSIPPINFGRASIPAFPTYPAGTKFRMTGLTNPVTRAVELYFQATPPGASAAELTVATRRAPGQPQAGVWEPLMILDAGTRLVGFFPDDLQTLLTFKAKSGFSLWRHAETGEFDQERVFVETDEPLRDTQTHRVTVQMGASAGTQGGQTVQVRATELCDVIINGRRAVVGPTRSWTALSNAQGAVTITVPMENGLYAPGLTLSSSVFAQDVTIDLNAKTQDYLKTLSTQDLSQAKDPRTSRSVIPDPGNAGAVAQALREIAAKAPAPRLGPNPPGIQANAAITLTPKGATPRPMSAYGEAGSRFKLTRNGGRLTFTPLSQAAAAAHWRQATAIPSPMGLFDVFEDVWNFAKDQFNNFVEILVDGAKMALTLAINGVKYAYNFTIETVAHVFDAINWVLDAAGAALGEALGWLLEKLGGLLFDWAAIRRRRDEIKTFIRDRARNLPNLMSDPKVGLQSAVTAMSQARGTLAATLQQYQPNQVNRSFGSLLGAAPVLSVLMTPAMRSGSGDSALPALSWIMDRATAILPALSVGPSLPNIPNLPTLLGGAISGVTSVAGKAAGAAADFRNLAFTWITDDRAFTSATFEPILAVIITHLIDLIDGLVAIVNAVGDLLSALFRNLDALFAWFDQELPKCFFGGFYRGLTHAALTPLDLVCLVAAMPGSVASGGSSGGSARALAALDDTPEQNLRDKALRLEIVECITSAINAFYTAITPAQADRVVSWVGYAVTAVDLAAKLSGSLCRDTTQQNSALLWANIIGTTVSIVVSGGMAGLIRYDQGTGPAAGKFGDVVSLLQIFMGATHLARMAIAFGAGDDNDAVVNLIAAVQNALVFGIRAGARPTSAPVALAYGAVQGGLTGVRTWISAERPI
jgi:hypothetical protein